MDRFEAMEILVAVADQGGFAAAARALRVSPPAVTRGIAALEARLGVTLFHRSTRAVSLTDEGTVFLERARRLLADLGDAERQLRGAHGEPRGQLYITTPTLFGRLHVLPTVTALLNAYPELTIRMMLIDRNVRIVEEGIDIAVRIGPLADSTLKAIRIGTVRQMLVASPDYITRNGRPERPSELTRHDLIGTTGPRTAREWRFGKGRDTPVKIKPRLIVNMVDTALAAAEAGLGIANLLSYQVNDALHEGRLIELLRTEAPETLPIHLLYEASRASLPATRCFIEAMQARARQHYWNVLANLAQK